MSDVQLIAFDSEAETSATFSVDVEKRVIAGRILPWGDRSRPALDSRSGKTFSFTFERGTVELPDPEKVRLNYNHDTTAPVGVATSLEDREDGIYGTFKVARTPDGDRILSLAEDRILTAFSVGIDGQFTERNGVQHSQKTYLTETSVVVTPAFERAEIMRVAAQAAANPTKEISMEENVSPVEETADLTGVSFSADDVKNAVVDGIKAAFAADDVRIPVQATPGLQVREESIYRFSGAIPGRHDFSRDLINGVVNGDAEAKARAVGFMSENLFAPLFVDSGDTAAVNPTKYRADMYKDEAPAQPTPLYDFFHKGGLSDITPFSYSQLDTYSGLLADHVEGVEPTGGTFATEIGATVVPAPISGKIHVTREVADQQGNPAVSGLVWTKFQRVFNQMLETKTASLLASGTYSTFAAPAAGASGAVIGAALESGVVDLQFAADGSRFVKMFGHLDLYKQLSAAVADDGRKLYPILNPSNADGTAASRFGHINVAGLTIDPTWSLGLVSDGTAHKSYLADPSAVHVWNSGLTKLDKLGEDVEGYDIGAWAYFAGIVYDASGIKTVSYDPTA